MKIDIPEYNKNTGLQLCWGDGYMIKVASENNKVVISANREGLISMVNHLLNLAVIVKTCSDICFTIGQKNCQMFVAKLHKFHHPHNRMRFYPAHSVLSFPDFAVDTFLPQRFLR